MNPLTIHKINGVTYADALDRLNRRRDHGPFAAFVAYVADIDNPAIRCWVAQELFRAFDPKDMGQWTTDADPIPVIDAAAAAGFDLPGWSDKHGRTLLHFAAGYHSPDKARSVCDRLLRAGCDPNKRDLENARPISYAAQADWSGVSPLCDALRKPLTPELYEFARNLLDRGEDPNGFDLRTGCRPLHLLLLNPPASAGGAQPLPFIKVLREDLIQRALNAGADINAAGPNGCTAVHLAAAAPDTYLNRIRQFTQTGQTPNKDARDVFGRTVEQILALPAEERGVLLAQPAADVSNRPPGPSVDVDDDEQEHSEAAANDFDITIERPNAPEIAELARVIRVGQPAITAPAIAGKQPETMSLPGMS